PHATALGYLTSGLYEDKGAYPSAVDIPNVKIFRFEENIYYANIDAFKKLFIKNIGFRVEDQLRLMNEEVTGVEREFKAAIHNSSKSKKQQQHIKQRFQKQFRNGNTLSNNENILSNGGSVMDDVNLDQVTTVNESGKIVQHKIIQVNEFQLVDEMELNLDEREKEKEKKIAEIKRKYQPVFEFVIIDCSPVNYIDMMGIKTLIQIYKDLKEVNVTVLLCQVRPMVYRQLQRMNYMDIAGKDTIHVTINDAVLHALKTRASRGETIQLPGTAFPFVGVENLSYTEDDYDGQVSC
ncbi:unnamed protein product, partial [Didymodactylos carnosus]